MVTVSGLTIGHRGGAAPVLSDISFALPRGALLAVIGPSGVGKSTLCAAFVGEIEVFAGHAALDGSPLAASGRAPDRVSFVPQAPAAFGELTVAETLGYAVRLRSSITSSGAGAAGRIGEVLDRVHLSSSAAQRVSRLSGGQLRRLSVAMELLSDPALLILDEPTSGLDDGLDRHLMRDLADLAADGTTIIVVTHSTGHLSMASHVLAISGGHADPAQGRVPSRVGFFGAPRDLLPHFGADSVADVMDALRHQGLPGEEHG